MKKILLVGVLACLAGTAVQAQTDTLQMNNQKLAVNVKEVTEDAVKYTYPGEDILNTVYKNGVQKIIFKSGRIQTFSESTSFKAVGGVDDYGNVTVTAVENEVKGLYKVGDVSSKAKGTTTFSNQERVKERAYRKLKIQAALMGANVIYLTNQRSEGNKYGGYFSSGSSAETNLTGVAYSNVLPNLEEFNKLIGSKTDFSAYLQSKLYSSDSDMSKDNIQKAFKIHSVKNDNGVINIEGELEGVKNYNSFRVVNFNAEKFNIFYKDKSTAYNIEVSLK